MLFDANDGSLERSWQELLDGVMNIMVGYVCTQMCTYEATCLSTHMFSVTGQAILVGTCQEQYQWNALVARIPKMPSYAWPGAIQVSKAWLARGTSGVRQLVVHNQLHRCHCTRSILGNFTSKPKRWRARSFSMHVGTTVCITELGDPARARPAQTCQQSPLLSILYALLGKWPPQARVLR
jgi:hypothetical protein